ncbi:MAG: class I SAM-dependent methyltransferase [Methylobacter sp.]|nr:class I SAM-dependent methyltransferase [Methylobacter sp.]
MNKRITLVNVAHELLAERLQPGDIAIDATVGNGYDTLFLAEQVAETGKVFGFDIQHAALQAAQEKCQQANLQNRVSLIQASHADMAEHIPEAQHGYISAIMFNLGYLPGGDKTVITQTDSTLSALTAAIRLLSPRGLITLLAYPGHQGGDQETEQVSRWCEQLDNRQFNFNTHYSNTDSVSAPRLFVISKLN